MEKGLPPKKETILKMGMTEMQKKYYAALLQKDIGAVNGGAWQARDVFLHWCACLAVVKGDQAMDFRMSLPCVARHCAVRSVQSMCVHAHL